MAFWAVMLAEQPELPTTGPRRPVLASVLDTCGRTPTEDAQNQERAGGTNLDVATGRRRFGCPSQTR